VTWVIFLAIFSQRDHRVAFHGKRPNYAEPPRSRQIDIAPDYFG
jgi:hypothetical protein